MITGMDHDLGELPARREHRKVLVYVPGDLLEPLGHWETQEQDVWVVDLSGSPALSSGDSLRLTTKMIVE
jgi:hypothetical protein